MERLTDLLEAACTSCSRDIADILARDPSRYRTFKIPKKSGGLRTLCEPSADLKLLQRALVKELKPLFAIHDAAFAYRDGLSIKDNAARHAHSAANKQLDFADFFSSLSDEDWRACCRRIVPGWSAEDIEVSTRVFFNNTLERGVWRLAMGAPSSPWVSNVLLAPFDAFVTNQLAPSGVIYTRYADDLTFSAPDEDCLAGVDDAIEAALVQCRYERLTLNAHKTRAASLPNLGAVTGVFVDGRGGMSAGEDRKADVLAGIKRAFDGELQPRDMASLKGSLAYVLQIEPAFRDLLDQCFGASRVDSIIQYRPDGGWHWEQRA